MAALEQTAEHLSRRTLDAAVAWARARDSGTADDLAAVLEAARARKVPLRTEPYPGIRRR